jgi:beta-phosphoglucomutase-like phosphatase (HAD superfamily)
MVPPGQYRHVLFDVDGTIAETEGNAHLPAFNRALQEAGLSWRWTSADYKHLLKTAGGFERLLRFAAENGHDVEALRDTLAAVHKNKNRHFAAIMASGAVKPREGFADLVMSLARNNTGWSVVTTTSRGNWEALWNYSLAPLGLPVPEVIVCGEDVAAKKPDPEAYLVALKRLNIPATECCAIEDSRNGLLAARGAGLEVIIVRSEFFSDENFDEAGQVVDELSLLGKC